MGYLRDFFWFARHGKVPLHRYLRDLAKQSLQVAGGVAKVQSNSNTCNARLSTSLVEAPVKPNDDLCQRRRSWRWLSFALPPDLLLAALTTSTSAPTAVDLLSPNMATLLADGGFAEIHLHRGAALSFPHLWIFAMARMADLHLGPKAFESPGACFYDGRLLAPWLVRLANARWLLSCFLLGLKKNPTYDFRQFLNSDFRTQVQSNLDTSHWMLLIRCLDELCSGQLKYDAEKNFKGLMKLFSRLSDAAAFKKPDDLSQLAQLDPLSSLWGYDAKTGKTPEMRFIAAGLSYLEAFDQETPGPRTGDPLFAKLFGQVVRLRNLTYRHVVQRPMTPGLQWFVRVYDRIWPFKKITGVSKKLQTKLLTESVLNCCGVNHGLNSLETRTAMEPHWNDPWEGLKSVDGVMQGTKPGSKNSKAYSQNAADMEWGWVYHFVRDRGGEFKKGRSQAYWQDSHANPAAEKLNPSGFRYATFYGKKNKTP